MIRNSLIALSAAAVMGFAAVPAADAKTNISIGVGFGGGGIIIGDTLVEGEHSCGSECGHIVINPADPSGINPAIKEATDAGIVVVVVDQGVTEPSAYIVSNNQEEYAYLGAKWLFEQIGGKGDVLSLIHISEPTRPY
mgnify:CR=1 FL=1